MTNSAKTATTPAPPTPRVEDLLCFSIYAAGHDFNRLYKRLLDPLGLTYPQYLVMVALWSGDGVTVGALGDMLGLESSTLTPLLKRLEAAGLIQRRRDAVDERQVRLFLTNPGEAMRARAADLPGCVLEAAGMGEAEMRRMRARLLRMREHLAAATVRRSISHERDR